MPVTTGSAMNPTMPVAQKTSESVRRERRHGQRSDEEEGHHGCGADEPLELQPLVAAGAPEAHHERRERERHDERARDVEGVVDDRREHAERVVHEPRRRAEVGVDQHPPDCGARQDDGREPDDRAPARGSAGGPSGTAAAGTARPRTATVCPSQSDSQAATSVAGQRALVVRVVVIGVQRGRDLHRAHDAESEQDPADRVARLPCGDQGADDRECGRGGEEHEGRPERLGHRRWRWATRRRPRRCRARSPAPDSAAKAQTATDAPATRHGLASTGVHGPMVRFRAPVVMGQESRRRREASRAAPRERAESRPWP